MISSLDCDSNIVFKTLQSADDIILLTENGQSLKPALQNINDFSQYAGRAFRFGKIQTHWFRKLQTLKTNYRHKGKRNYLGINVGHNKNVQYVYKLIGTTKFLF